MMQVIQMNLHAETTMTVLKPIAPLELVQYMQTNMYGKNVKNRHFVTCVIEKNPVAYVLTKILS